MTIMMSDSLIGRVDPRSLVSRSPPADHHGINVDILIDDETFIFTPTLFKRESKKVTISFFSTIALVEKIMDESFSMDISLVSNECTLYKFTSINKDNSEIEIKLNSNEYLTQLSILSV